MYLKEIDERRSPNVSAPMTATHYWKLADDATLRNVVLVVRDDEAHHRDVNHGLRADSPVSPSVRPVTPDPRHADDPRMDQ